VNPNPSASTDSESAPKTTAKAPRRRKSNPFRHAERPGVPLLLTVPEAAEALRTNPEALRARLRRSQVVGEGGAITSPLGPGIVGLKLGATWRVRLDAAK
jgi:hypothetical protein